MYLSNTKLWSIANMLEDPAVAIMAIPAPVANGLGMLDPMDAVVRSLDELNKKIFCGMTPDEGPQRIAHSMLEDTLHRYAERGIELTILVLPLPVKDAVFTMPDAMAREEIFNRARAAATILWHREGQQFAPRYMRNEEIQIVINTMTTARRMTSHKYSDRILTAMNQLSEEVLKETITVGEREGHARIAAQSSYSARELQRHIKSTMSGLSAAAHLPVDPVAEKSLLTRALELHEKNLISLERFDIEAIHTNSYEYPGEQIAEDGGIAQDTEYWYVSNTFLNGLVNYGTNHKPFLMARYGIFVPVEGNEEETISIFDSFYNGEFTEEEMYDAAHAAYQKYCDASVVGHVHPKFTGDDWLVMYENASSFIFMWYDQDSSDCGVARYSRDSCEMVGIETFEDFVVQRLALFLKNQSDFISQSTPLYKPLIVEPSSAIANGWKGS